MPIEDWTLIKTTYPDIENLDKDLPHWEKSLIDLRLESIRQNPDSLKSIDELFKELDRKE